MTLTLTLPANLEQKLQEMAAQNGQNTADYTLALIEKQVNNGYEGNGLAAHAAPHHEPLLITNAQDEEYEDPDALDRAIAKITNRTPEQIIAARERAMAASHPPRPLPPGKTFAEVVAGQWPGNETDEEVQAAFDELS